MTLWKTRILKKTMDALLAHQDTKLEMAVLSFENSLNKAARGIRGDIGSVKESISLVKADIKADIGEMRGEVRGLKFANTAVQWVLVIMVSLFAVVLAFLAIEIGQFNLKSTNYDQSLNRIENYIHQHS